MREFLDNRHGPTDNGPVFQTNMPAPAPGTEPQIFRFGVFDFDGSTGELVKNGTTISLQPQPAELLRLLLLRAGELVTRQAIERALWDDATTVDFDLGVNRCVRQLRAALLDDSDAPRYIETIPRRGYRFIAPVSVARGPAPPIAPPVPEHRASIAVLPFANLSGDPNDEYFGDGLAEEITNALTQIAELKVIARTSAFAFKGRNEDIRKIAETLGVSNVLEGSVRRAGTRIRVTAQLIHAADGAHLSSKRYESEINDIFALQDEISADIANQLKLRFTAPKHSTSNVAAYEAFLEGRFHTHKFTPEGFQKALECFERAVAIDPGYSRAHTGIAEYYLGTVMDYMACPREMLPKAEAAALRAIQLDENDAEGHAALGEATALLYYDWPAAKQHFERACELNFHAHVRMRYLFWYLLPHGRLQEAEAEADYVIRKDPILVVGRTAKAIPLMLGRAYEQAAENCLRALELDPRFPYALYLLVRTRVYQQRSGEALVFAERLLQILGRSYVSLSSLGLAHAASGDRGAANRLAQEIEGLPGGAQICPTGIASIYALLGENAKAFEWMERAIEYRDPRVLWIKTLPWLDSLRSDPRYPGLLGKLNLNAAGPSN
jgi:TolB-like protein/Tfp pilus assembly protein PilF